jgi:hypothetical protein
MDWILTRSQWAPESAKVVAVFSANFYRLKLLLISLRSNNPARANISWYSLSDSRDKWHPARSRCKKQAIYIPSYRDHFHIRCSIDHVENTFLPFSELTLQCEWQWTRLSAIRQNHLNVLTIYNNVIAFFCYINRMTLWSKQSVRAKYR